MKKLPAPLIEEIPFTRIGVDGFVDKHRDYDPVGTSRDSMFLIDFPTVYIVHDEASDKYNVYVGETADIRSRTIQHLEDDPQVRDDWKSLAESGAADMYVIGHELFNKSLTLDVENRLMHYLSGVDAVENLYNRRTNPQKLYHTQENFDEVFRDIWSSLRSKNPRLFPDEEVIRDSALFKASPFHKLTDEQIAAKRDIIDRIYGALQTGKDKQLIMVRGEAGSGKTVLLSSLFYELFQNDPNPDDPFSFQDLDAYLLVNHPEQLTVYTGIARKLGLLSKKENRISRPTTFINHHSPLEKVDVVLIDEAHLLWTQGKQSYRGKNQLIDIIERARVIIAVFDDKQILAANQHWEKETIEKARSYQVDEILLHNQMRINAAPDTIRWLRHFIDKGTIQPVLLDDTGHDARGYEIKVFDSPQQLHDAVKDKASTVEEGLSRLLATFDWDYSTTPRETYWSVKIGDFEIPWNSETFRDLNRVQRSKAKHLAWAEQEHTINEAGSTFTIQGFDLNYAGVIIGPSVTYRDGRVVFDPSQSANRGATNRRTLSDGTKVRLGETLLRNELNVLLTRGVNGLYVYAVDPALREALKKAVGWQGIPTSISANL